LAGGHVEVEIKFSALSFINNTRCELYFLSSRWGFLANFPGMTLGKQVFLEEK